MMSRTRGLRYGERVALRAREESVLSREERVGRTLARAELGQDREIDLQARCKANRLLGLD